jgi:GT2 family glycosyltransferase
MIDGSSEGPSFSVIVVTWNRVELLGRCLESLRRQSYRRFEVIVVGQCVGRRHGSCAEGRVR